MGQRTDQRVDESRRQLRAILTRREFVTAAGIGALGLAGCSSPNDTPPPGSSGGIPAGLQRVTGTVSLPAGSTLKFTDLSVDVMTQTVPVSTAAGFTVGISPSGPSLALLLDANGDGVLMAMFDPSVASHAISTHTTAVALLYYGMNAYMFPASAMSQILALIDGDPAIAALAAAIATAVAVDPQALANNAAPLGPAITQALQTMGLTGSSLKGSAASTSLKTSPTSMPAARLMDVPTLMTVAPSAEQNGVMVNQDDTTTSLLISNTKRRPGRVYIYEMSADPPGGGITPAALVAGPFDLDTTEALSLWSALADFTTFFHGTSPWSPVNLAPIPLALMPATADQTIYQVVLLTASLKTVLGDALEPPMFRDLHFATDIGMWRIDDKNLMFTTFFRDLCLPLFCLVLGVGTIEVSASALKGVSAAAVGTATFARIILQLQYGSLGQMEAQLAQAVQDAVKNKDSIDFWEPEVLAVIGKAEAKALAAQTAAQQTTRLSRALKMFLNVLEPLFIAGAIGDLGAVMIDFYNSDMGSTWTATVIRQKLNLHPNPPAPINSGDRVTFSVSPPANIPPGTFQYDWTQSSPFATLSANGEVNVGNMITTTQLSVDLVTTGSDVNPITVLVIGYDIHGVEIGRAGTTVTFLAPSEIQPTNAALNPGDQRTFSVIVGGLGGAPAPQVSSYRWTLTGTSGSIGSSNVVTTTVPYVNYTASVPGIDSLHVDVLYGTTVVAKADVGITVVDKASIKFTISGIWNPTLQPADATYSFNSFAYVRGSGTPGADTGDLVLFNYDTAAGLPDPVTGLPTTLSGVTLTLVVGFGEVLKTGDTFTKIAGASTVTPGHFQFGLVPDLNNVAPGDPGYQTAPPGTGTCTLNNVSQLLNGTYVVQYSFSITGSTGMITGSGVARTSNG